VSEMTVSEMTWPGLRDRPAADQIGTSGDRGRDERGLRARRPASPPPAPAELARMLAEFHARGGTVTVCPPVYVLPIQGGAAA
jgi:hypothetical protein